MTKKYAVIGNPITHSRSPFIHKMFAKGAGIDIEYIPLLSPWDGFSDLIEHLMDTEYSGVNVTAPFKVEAYDVAHHLEYVAEEAGACNTLTFNGDDIFGDNTDGDGFIADIRYNLNVELDKKRVLIIGAGGAARAILVRILEEGAAVTIANRTYLKSQELANQYDDVQGYGFDDLRDQEFDVVINATSAGWTDSELLLPETVFASSTLAYDLAYGKETSFMAAARKNGAATVSDGLGMLVEQAAWSFKIWHDVFPDTVPVLAELRRLV